MWGQLITMQLKPGREHELPRLLAQLASIEPADSGLVRTVVGQRRDDPSRAYVLVVFASEELARAREQDPRRQEGLAVVREIMGELLAAPPEFADLDVIADEVPTR